MFLVYFIKQYEFWDFKYRLFYCFVLGEVVSLVYFSLETDCLPCTGLGVQSMFHLTRSSLNYNKLRTFLISWIEYNSVLLLHCVVCWDISFEKQFFELISDGGRNSVVSDINKQWEVITLEQLTAHMTLIAGAHQQRPESPTITPPNMRWIQRT